MKALICNVSEHLSVQELPEQTSQLQALTQLKLSGCVHLQTLPSELWCLTSLQILDLQGEALL